MLALVWAGAGRAQAGEAVGDGPPFSGAAALGEGPQPVSLGLAARKDQRKGRKKRKKTVEDDFGPMGIAPISRDAADNGIGIHREQEGVDRPYLLELSGNAAFSYTNAAPRGEGSGKRATTELGGEGFIILGSLAIGGELRYQVVTGANETVVTSPDPVSGGTTVTRTQVSTRDTTYSIGPLVKFYFGSVDHALLLPFAYAGYVYQGGESRYGDEEPAPLTGSVVRLGGGLGMFVDSNIAFTPKLEYRLAEQKREAAGEEPGKTTELQALFQITTFL